MFKAQSCPVGFEYLEDQEFDEQFELSLFETKSESAVDSTILNPEFVQNLETERTNKSIDDYILNRLQNSIVASNISNFLETASATLGHPQLHLVQEFPPNLLSFLPFPHSLLSLIKNLQSYRLHLLLILLK